MANFLKSVFSLVLFSILAAFAWFSPLIGAAAGIAVLEDYAMVGVTFSKQTNFVIVLGFMLETTAMSAMLIWLKLAADRREEYRRQGW